MATHNEKSTQDMNENFGLPETNFKPIAHHKSHTYLRITLITVSVLLLLGGGLFYWFLQHATPADQAPAADQPHPVAHPTDDASYATQPPQHMPDLVQEEAHSTTGTEYIQLDTPGLMNTVRTPQQHYYAVLGSYIDVDLAMDHANKLSDQGVDVSVLYPQPGSHFFYVGVEESLSYQDIREKWAELKALYGANIWIVKY